MTTEPRAHTRQTATELARLRLLVAPMYALTKLLAEMVCVDGVPEWTEKGEEWQRLRGDHADYRVDHENVNVPVLGWRRNVYKVWMIVNMWMVCNMWMLFNDFSQLHDIQQWKVTGFVTRKKSKVR